MSRISLGILWTVKWNTSFPVMLISLAYVITIYLKLLYCAVSENEGVCVP